MVAAASKQLVETAGVASSTEDVCSPAWLSDADLASTDSTVLVTNLVNESSTNNQPHQTGSSDTNSVKTKVGEI